MNDGKGKTNTHYTDFSAEQVSHDLPGVASPDDVVFPLNKISNN